MANLPTFVVAGVPKAGTTTLHQYFRAHPHVFVSEAKELHYFSIPDLEARSQGPGKGTILPTATRTQQDYEQQFQDADPTLPIGDVSPSYLIYPGAHVRMREILGSNLKVILLLRNPIDRAFSNWVHLRRTGIESLEFLPALEAEEDRWQGGYSDFWCYLKHSTYIPQIDKLAETFPLEQIKILRFDDLVTEPITTMAEISEFLGVPSPTEVAELSLNPGGWIPKSRLGKAIERPSRVKYAVRNRLPRPVGDAFRSIRARTRNRADSPTLDPLAGAYIFDRTRDDLIALQDRFGIDLTRSRKFPDKTAGS